MKESIYNQTMPIKKHYIVAIILLLLSFEGLSQVYPVQVSPNMIPPYSMRLSDYNTATREKIIVNLLLTDVAELNRQVGIRMYIENGRNIAIQSSPVVSGAMPIYLDGGVPVRLTNLDLQVYFQFENLQGISPQQYNQPLPDGLYQFCFEVYDWGSGLPISAKSCATAYLVLNDPPILNVPSRGELVAQKDPQNIIFQWTPRHMNATNVQYEFTLTELWDPHMDPQAAFLASRPLYKTTTSANTLLYGPAETSLLPDKAYGWRVRAVVTDGISETSVFKNDGYSEIFHFVYTGDCEEPAFLLAESESPTTENIYWQDGGHLKYHVQYKKKALDGTDFNEWFEANAYSNNAKLYNLERGTVYEFRVGGQCNPEGGYSYSQIQEFTTPIDVKSSGYNCGITSEIKITNTRPLPQLFRNEVFTAGDFPVMVREISGGDGTFSGWGYIVVPYLQDTRIRVQFKGIRINDEYQLINGIVETEYDEEWSGVDDIQDEIEAIEAIAGSVLELLESGISLIRNNNMTGDDLEAFLEELTNNLPEETIRELEDIKNQIKELEEQLENAETEEEAQQIQNQINGLNQQFADIIEKVKDEIVTLIVKAIEKYYDDNKSQESELIAEYESIYSFSSTSVSTGSQSLNAESETGFQYEGEIEIAIADLPEAFKLSFEIQEKYHLYFLSKAIAENKDDSTTVHTFIKKALDEIDIDLIKRMKESQDSGDSENDTVEVLVEAIEATLKQLINKYKYKYLSE